jgi:hypothetical protein
MMDVSAILFSITTSAISSKMCLALSLKVILRVSSRGGRGTLFVGYWSLLPFWPLSMQKSLWRSPDTRTSRVASREFCLQNGKPTSCPRAQWEVSIVRERHITPPYFGWIKSFLSGKVFACSAAWLISLILVDSIFYLPIILFLLHE